MGLFKRPAGVAGSAAPAILIGAFVAFGGVLYGYDTGTISGILGMNYWLKTVSTTPPMVNATTGEVTYSITAGQTSEIVSLLSVGTFFGSLLSAPLADYLGRRLALLLSAAIVFNLGVALQTASTGIPLFVAGRVIAGLGVGLISALVPLYQAETLPKWIRGPVVGMYQWFITIGILVAGGVNYNTQDRNDSGSYRIPLAIQFAWAIIIVVGMTVLPETPRFWIRQGKRDKAEKSLARLRQLPQNHEALAVELNEIQANHDFEMGLSKLGYLDCFRGTLGKRLATGCLLQALQQLTGVNFIFYYGTTYFQSSGVGVGNPFLISVATDVVNVVMTIPGLWAVERWGRRPILFWGAIGMFVCQMIVASVGTAIYDQDPVTGVITTSNFAGSKVTVAFVCIYIAFFASTWGISAWIVTSELFPLQARAKCLSMTTASNWLLNFAIGYATPYLVKFGPGNANLQSKVFFLWGGFCLICAIFTWGLIYETKGLSLEEVDELYSKVPHAWNSPGFVPTTNFTTLVANVNVKEYGKGHTLEEIEAEAQRHASVSHAHVAPNKEAEAY